jgi:hypothetical protein
MPRDIFQRFNPLNALVDTLRQEKANCIETRDFVTDVLLPDCNEELATYKARLAEADEIIHLLRQWRACGTPFPYGAYKLLESYDGRPG